MGGKACSGEPSQERLGLTLSLPGFTPLCSGDVVFLSEVTILTWIAVIKSSPAGMGAHNAHGTQSGHN